MLKDVCHSGEGPLYGQLVQLTVQCCIQNMRCGFQFALEFVKFNLLLHYACHSVECQAYCQFGSAYSTVLYTDCV